MTTERKVSDEQIEKAAGVVYENLYGPSIWRNQTQHTQNRWKVAIRNGASFLQYPPEPVADDLVEAMLNAYASHVSSSSGMAAAARVCVKRALRPIEYFFIDKSWERHKGQEERPRDRCCSVIRELLIHREAELLNSKPKTPEERVTIEEWMHDKGKWIVLVNGCNMVDSATFPKDQRLQAEIYRLGLIAKLKEQV